MKKALALIEDDPWLAPYEADISQRLVYFQQALQDIKATHQSLLNFAQGDKYLGFNYDKKASGWWYREWAPAALDLKLVGDFNQWSDSHAMERLESGIWEIFIPDSDGLKHESKVKVRVTTTKGTSDRIPAYIKRAVQDETTYDFSGQIWQPTQAYQWQDQDFDLAAIQQPIIYECHIGMAQEAEKVGTFREFAELVLPRIKSLGYNCIQLMAIKEHPYYGSFGYHVANFFAVSSRFGTPEDLKYLIDQAHQMGIAVIMDMVHSHAVKNLAEGLADFDGSGHQYFHAGGRGYHTGWDSMLFDYGKKEVQQFLLSNIRFWLEEYHFDGFRFDGVTSMLYLHHGDHVSFDHYDKYFKEGVDNEAVRYLQLANTLIHDIKLHAISIAEDMSGMPGICRLVSEGGVGFDYRLGMGIPDYWIKLLKHSRDEDWSMNELWQVMSNRRWKEKTIAYAESHDQAMVGDKTLAFWLMDKEMYWHMQRGDDNLIIARGIALHKMIRLLTASAGGEGYLNFIGNEFGHPEWLDFPREGNNWSYQYARRQWSLVDNPELKYRYLNDFDQAMIQLLKDHQVIQSLPGQVLNIDEVNKTLIFERNHLIFVFNFHPEASIFDYKFPVKLGGDYNLILSSDESRFGGYDRVDMKYSYPATKLQTGFQLSIYNTCRTAMVFKPKVVSKD